MNFVVFSDDWGVHPSSCQHLFRRLGPSHPTVWVNTVGMRPPRLSLEDARKVFRKVGTMLKGQRRKSHANGEYHPIVCAPPMLPFQRPAFLGTWNDRSAQRVVKARLGELRVARFRVVTTVPNVHGVVNGIGAEKIIYYCVDDFSEWPGLDRNTILEMEKKLLARVHRVICTSQALYDRFSGKLPTFLLPHGVDVDFFASEAPTVHPLLETIPEPRVGYYGLFDRRTDSALLASVAASLPKVSIVITGPTEGRADALRRLPNIHFTGPVPYAELPSILKGWKACLLPYALNDLTEKINPLKLKEYIASGKPVLSSPLPEARKLIPYLRIAANEKEWVQCIEDALGGRWRPERGAVRDFLAPHDWAHKADEFLKICEDA